MKKMLILAVLVVALVALAANVALAGGWWLENDTAIPGYSGPLGSGGWTTDTVSPVADSGSAAAWDAQVGNAGADSPHGGFSTSTNYCKTCHAVHLAGGNSYRLLKDGSTTEARSAGEGANAAGYTPGLGNTRGNECMYCHDSNAGMSDARPYALGDVTTVRGEHTIGATVLADSVAGVLPDRDPSGQGAILQCYQCHSVHGANTLDGPGGPAENWPAGELSGQFSWGGKILRTNPNTANAALAGDVIGAGATGWDTADDQWYTTQSSVDASNLNSLKTAFCADCHDKNPNWSYGGDASGTDRPNKTSHVQGPNDDGTLEVYGTSTLVAVTGSGMSSPSNGCRGCHNSRDSFNMPSGMNLIDKGDGFSGTGTGLTNIRGSFPHQAQESKFLGRDAARYNGDGTANTAGVLNNANRALESMDAVCLSCHQWTGGTAGVGQTF